MITLDFNSEDLGQLIIKSRDSPRKRAIKIFQSDNYPGPQVGINVIQPESYIQPHFRYDDESIMHLQGRFCDLLFDENGKLTDKIILSQNATKYFSLPKETYHTIISLENDSAIWFAIQGPYNPERASKSAPWAPAENDASAKYFFNYLKQIARE
jgi:cupin fold WbuC family metalloprotein